MAVVRNELRADLRITGENAVKAGLKGVGNSAEAAGDDLRQMGKDAGYLQRQLLELKATQIALVKQLNETGDVTLIKDINKARREVRQFERLSVELAGESTEVGIEAGAGLAKGMATGFSAGGPALIAAAVAAISALLPGLGAIVSGAVSGITGTGGIIGGVVAAAHDPAVKRAAEDVGMALKSSFSEVGVPFVGPVVESLGLLREAGQRVAVDLKHDFDILAPALVPFTKGLVGLVEEMMPGLTAAFTSSLPVLKAISNELPKIGHAIGEFFRITTEDSDSAVLGFVALSKIIQNTLIGGAKFIALLGDMYKGMVVNSEAVTKLGLQTTGWLAATGPAGTAWVKNLNDQHNLYAGLLKDLENATHGADGLAGGFTLMGSAADRAAEDIADVQRASDSLFNVTMNMEEAQVRWAKQLRDTAEELRNGKKTLDLNTEEGIKNRESLDALVNVAEQWRLAQAALGVPMDQVNQKYLAHIESIRQLALKMGFARDEVDKFIAQWLKIPDAKTIELNLKAGGDAAAWSALRNLERQQAAGPSMGPLERGRVEFRAGGGPVMAGRGYIVGEHGIEFFSPSQNGYISSAPQTAAMMSGASGGSAARPVFNFTLAPSGNAAMDALVSALWPFLLQQVRVNGGTLSSFGAA